jgi:hypothetical protein
MIGNLIRIVPKWHLALLIGAGIALIVLPVMDVARVYNHADWNTYEQAARRWLAGDALYSAEQLAGPYSPIEIVGTGYVYPPPSILLFATFLPVGYLGWTAINVLLLVSGLAAIAVRELGRHAVLGLAVMLVVLAGSRPYIEGIAVGNINLGLAGVFAWAWALGRGSRAVPVLAGIGSAIKLFPAALAFWATPRSAVRAVLTAAGVTSGLAVVTLPLVGLGAWQDYVTAARHAEPICTLSARPLACLVIPFAGDATTLVLLLAGAVLATVAVFARSDVIAFAMIVVAVLVTQLELFSHSFLFVMVLGFAALCRSMRVYSDRRAGTALDRNPVRPATG